MEGYWTWKNYLKNIVAGLIILANILLIFTIRHSNKCRKQVFIQTQLTIDLSVFVAEIQPGDHLSGSDGYDGRVGHPHQHAQTREVAIRRLQRCLLINGNCPRWTFGPVMCQVMISMEVILLCASINNFVLVNLDRLLCLKFKSFPVRSSSVTSSGGSGYKRIKIGIALCWGLAFIPAVPMWFSTTDGTDWKCKFPFQNVSSKFIHTKKKYY